MHRTYVKGKQLSFAQVLAVYEKIVKRPATRKEIQAMRLAWIKRTAKRPRQK